MKIVIPEFIDILPQKYVDELKKYGQVVTFSDFPNDEDEIIKRVGDAEIVIGKWFEISEKLIAQAPNLKHIITLSAGYGALPTQAARQRGITISNCPTHNSQAVAEHVIALLFAVSRRIVAAQANIQAGTWRESQYSFQGTEVSDKKMGIVGYGNIGKRVAVRANGLGMHVEGLTSKSTGEELERLLRTSDVIVLSLPYSEKVRGLIDEKRLAMMKKNAVIINTSRGSIVDQKALLAALKDNTIGGAGLDVAEGEVIKGQATDEIVALAKLPNVVITPHIAYNTVESAQRMGEEMVANVKAITEGKPINVVN